MFTAKTPINIISAIGLGLGAVFGERAIAIWLGSTGNGRNPMFNGRRQPSRGGTPDGGYGAKWTFADSVARYGGAQCVDRRQSYRLGGRKFACG
jgi:hypothetical protein